MNKSGLYTEFRDKEDLFVACLRHYLESQGKRRLLTKEPLGWKNVETFLKNGPLNKGEQQGCFSVNSMREFAILPDDLRKIKTIEVESWLRRLPLAKSSCAKIRGVMSVLFNHTCRHELFDRNPIQLVRQGAKRKKTPCVLTPSEIRVLADGLAIRERTLVLLAASTGLRQSELFGLKWGDINFAEGTMNVTRSIVCGFVGPCKTESSQKPVPIHPVIVEALEKWKVHQRYRKLDDWVFASGCRRGRRPYWGQAILRKYIRPRALELGIEKRFGWHTFRHTIQLCSEAWARSSR